MLSHSEKESILSEFPNIKLSYENITHKKFIIQMSYWQYRKVESALLGLQRITTKMFVLSWNWQRISKLRPLK